MTIDDITGLVTLLISIGGFIILWKKFPVEKKKTEAGAASDLSGAAGEISDAAIALLPPLRARVDELQTEKARLISDIKLQEETLQEEKEKNIRLIEINRRLTLQVNHAKARAELFEDYANRLIEQICGLGAEPVKLENGKPTSKTANIP